jgi:hypothetical protein
MELSRRTTLLALTVLVATAAPASAATLHLKAPREVDRAEKFRVTAFGKAKPQRDYLVSVIYHDNDQGRCARTVEKEITSNEYYAVFYLRKFITDQEGRFEITSRRIVGGDKKVSGKFCGYLTNANGENRDRVVRSIEFT